MQFPIGNRNRSTTRKGMGVIVVVIVSLLAGLTVMGLQNFFFVERIALDVGTTIHGDRALYLAQSAVDEAANALAQEINDPGSSVFEVFRSQEYTGTEIAFDLEVPYFENFLSKYPEDYEGYQLFNDGVQARVTYQNYFSGLPYERYGTLELSAQVTLRRGFGKKISRKVSYYEEFKTALMTTPRPFDQLTLYVNQIAGWVTPAFENGNIEASKKSIDPAVEGSTPAVRQYYLDYLTNFENETGLDLPIFDELRTMMQTPPLNLDVPPLKVFPDSFVAISNLDSIEDMKKLNLPGLIGPLNEEIETMNQQMKQDAKALDNAIDSSNSKSDAENKIKPAVKKLADTTYEVTELHQRRFAIYKEFQSLITMASGGLQTRLENFYKKMEADKWQKKAFHRISGGRTELEQLMAKYEPLNGVILIQNDSALDLSGMSVRGKLILVAAGDVNVNGLTVQDPSKDIVTVISYGIMKISGNIQANLVPVNQWQIIASNTQILGHLVINGVFDPAQFQGRLQYDPRIFSGTSTTSSDADSRKSYIFVGFGPRTMGSSVNRDARGVF